jgi:hypothetical protein
MARSVPVSDIKTSFSWAFDLPLSSSLPPLPSLYHFSCLFFEPLSCLRWLLLLISVVVVVGDVVMGVGVIQATVAPSAVVLPVSAEVPPELIAHLPSLASLFLLRMFEPSASSVQVTEAPEG